MPVDDKSIAFILVSGHGIFSGLLRCGGTFTQTLACCGFIIDAQTSILPASYLFKEEFSLYLKFDGDFKTASAETIADFLGQLEAVVDFTVTQKLFHERTYKFLYRMITSL